MTLRVSRPLLPMCAAVLLAGCGEEALNSYALGSGVGMSGAGTASRGNALWGASVVDLGNHKVAAAVTEDDLVRVVSLATSTSRRIQLPQGSRPTRIAATGDGDFVVLLRGSGQVATVRHGSVTRRDFACEEPRGLAWDDARQETKVACADGQLVTLSAAGRSAAPVGEELRDVFVIDGTTWVTTFRGAELLELDAEGQVVARLRAPGFVTTRLAADGTTRALTFTPRVAWRAVAQGRQVAMVHQVHLNDEVTTLTLTPGGGSTPATPPPYYGTGSTCGTSVVTSALTTFNLDSRTAVSTPVLGALPIDVTADATTISLVTLGNEAVVVTPWGAKAPCLVGAPARTPAPVGVGLVEGGVLVVGHDGRVVQPFWPETSAVVAPATAEPLDASRAFFHRQSPSGVACASCHAEGHDDGHTWNFQGQVVRTQDLSGGLTDTAPFHWRGELRNLDAVLHSTFETRMGGTLDPKFSTLALGRWLDSLPTRPGAEGDVAKGEAVFQASGCAGCHSGPRFTNNRTVDVGTGGAFQVPSLKGLRWRGPWMHDGCAKRLEDRFTPGCGGAAHGAVAPDDVPELVKYLQSL